jgi:Fe-S-cluster containining protein
MNRNSQTIRFLRRHIPDFACQPGCHDCCGPVTASSEEMARLPRKSAEAQARAMAELSCPHLGEQGCQVYAERPLICRLFGTTPRLACPNGRGPATMVEAGIEQQVLQYFAATRQVLV